MKFNKIFLILFFSLLKTINIESHPKIDPASSLSKDTNPDFMTTTFLNRARQEEEDRIKQMALDFEEISSNTKYKSFRKLSGQQKFILKKLLKLKK